MPDLSVLIPARNEMFLQNTVTDVLDRARADTEVIVVLDGAWPVDPIQDRQGLVLVHHSWSVGQRAAVNEAARFSRARYVMKLDAHCSVDEGFDVKLIESAKELGEDVTQVPLQYNHHAFNWSCSTPGCDWNMYQGPTPEKCPKCGQPASPTGGPHRLLVWQPRKSRLTTAWRFDRDLHFQYWREHEKTPEGKKEISETMSCLGACFFMSRDRYWELGGMDEEHGSWGQMGTEVACKSWLSGGRLVCNKRTWFSHMFRTQGGDFSFPYPLSGREVDHARKHSRSLWIDGTWPGAKRPLSWLVEHFAPVPGWEEVMPTDRTPGHDVRPAPSGTGAGSSSKSILYYSDCRGDANILTACRTHLLTHNLPIVSVTLAPIDLGHNIVFPGERGVLTMFRQILAGLEASDADIVFFAEHDCLYPDCHFDFTPTRDDAFFFDVNSWKVDASTGQALHYRCQQTSGLCAHRSVLIDHYRRRVEKVEREGYNHRMGYEPGNDRHPRGIDDREGLEWRSPVPYIDIRHSFNLTRNRWSQDQFRDKRTCTEWEMADGVPGWGPTKDRFPDFLREVLNGSQPQPVT